MGIFDFFKRKKEENDNHRKLIKSKERAFYLDDRNEIPDNKGYVFSAIYGTMKKTYDSDCESHCQITKL